MHMKNGVPPQSLDCVNFESCGRLGVIIYCGVNKVLYIKFNVPKWRLMFWSVLKLSSKLNFSGPVFLMIGGEGNLSSKWLNFGAMVEYAAQHNALLLGLEHRFYGKSHPLGKFICWFLLPCHYVIQES